MPIAGYESYGHVLAQLAAREHELGARGMRATPKPSKDRLPYLKQSASASRPKKKSA
jgi:hypothetical protein